MTDNFNKNQKIGILGGGQLGRMLIQSGIDFNFDIHVMDPDPHAPCREVSSNFTVGGITDYEEVLKFGKSCDVITIEIENVNIDALKELESIGKKVFPQPRIIELIQDKRLQKEFYVENSIPTADFILVDGRDEILQNSQFLPAFNKLGKEGYDGRGVVRINDTDNIQAGFDAPGLLEKLIDFKKELSVIVARNASGQVITYPVVELVFHPEANLVEFLFAPARIDKTVSDKAEKIAISVIEKLDMVGLLAVEMFLTKDDEILVNEIAPRPHNSGHQTIEGSITSQFEQHLRSILDLPLGATDLKTPSAMVNLLGENGYEGPAKYIGMEEVLAMKGTHVHLYGKKITKPFRKMGHVTIEAQDEEKLREIAKSVKNKIKVIS